jgi:hypothetical protein
MVKELIVVGPVALVSRPGHVSLMLSQVVVKEKLIRNPASSGVELDLVSDVLHKLGTDGLGHSVA